MREQHLKAHAAAVAEKLDGTQVSLAGFVLPIRLDGKLVKEFFLVPSLSTCSHGAFPPSTQMVYVKSANGILLKNPATILLVTGAFAQQPTLETFVYPGNTIIAESEYVITPTSIEVVESNVQRLRINEQ